MLDKVPGEVLSVIAYHLSLPTLAPPVNLLLTCRSINEAISPKNNPRLYARIYRSRFDITAVERRIGEVKARDVVYELRRREDALRKIREMVESGDLSEISDEQIWVIYLMLIENDGKNVDLLVSSDALIDLPTFLRLYHEQHLLAPALEPGYPAETVGRALIMWITWFLSQYGFDQPEPPHERDERLFVLRPYVFAPQEYEAYFAPWTILNLPLSHSQAPANNANPYLADLSPKSRSVKFTYFGRKLEISPPILSHAAILRFFSRRNAVIGRYPQEDGLNSESSLPPPSEMIEDLERLPGVFTDGTPLVGTSGRNVTVAEGHVNGPPGYNPPADSAPAPMSQIANASTAINNQSAEIRQKGEKDSEMEEEHEELPKDLLADSKQHDRDFKRLISCHNPFACRGLKPSDWRGCMEGCWEGTFSFFDFDAFREMLAGHSKALYQGPFGEQHQVWRLKETFVQRRKPGQSIDVDDDNEPTPKRAKLDKGKAKVEEEVPVEGQDESGSSNSATPPAPVPLHGPMTNAGFPVDVPSTTSAGLETPSAAETTLQSTIKQQLDALEGYEVIEGDELDKVLEETDETHHQDLEMLVTGVGHSAWGRFILKGRVRMWDGMISLVKEYAPDSRGKWIYRGYVVAGDTFVGRWRDTFTPEAYVGYEGTFILNRR